MAIPSQDPEKLRRRAYHAQYARENRERMNAAQKRFNDKHKVRLSEQTKQRRLDKLAAMTEEERRAFRAIEAARRMAYGHRLKDSVYAAYGGYECKCCGVTEKSFLSIDHVHNDGAKQRKETHGKNPQDIYMFLKRNAFPAGYQVLCMNCQIGKHRNGGICPHQGKV